MHECEAAPACDESSRTALAAPASASEVVTHEAEHGLDPEMKESAEERERALMKEIKELRGAVRLMHNDLCDAAECLTNEVWLRRQAQAEVKCLKDDMAIKEIAMQECIDVASDEQWPSFQQVLLKNIQGMCSRLTNTCARCSTSSLEADDAAAEQEAKELMSGWQPAPNEKYYQWSSESCRELYNSVRARARAAFAQRCNRLSLSDDLYKSDGD